MTDSFLPLELRSRLQNQLGEDFSSFESALGDAPPVSIRLNPEKQVQLSVDNHSIPWCEEGRYLSQRPNFTLDPLFHAGTYYVQEASSMAISHILKQVVDLNHDLRVLDLSAAPGGKATLLHSLISKSSLLIANEVISKRNSILQQNLARWGTDNTIVTQNDPRAFGALANYFDVILVDAPCSGEGLIRKNPAAAQEWSEANVRLCASRQQRILADVYPSLAPGGILIYSTCTFSEFENELNSEWFLNKSGFKNIELTFPKDWNIQTGAGDKPGYRFYPHHVRGEGFFVAAFQKSGAQSPPRKRSTSNNKLDRNTAEDERWLERPKDYVYLQQGKLRYAFPRAITPPYLELKRHLRIRSAGLYLGKTYPNGLQPSPELAFFPRLSNKVQQLELDRSTALDFLSHTGFDIPADLSTGRHLITHEGFGLGWINKLGNGQFRNNYPTAWRILNR